MVYKDAEITLPLSSNQLLLAGWILENDSYVSVPPDIAEYLNQRTILNSSERIVTADKAKLEEIKAKYPPKQENP